jgi:hypothetical protein
MRSGGIIMWVIAALSVIALAVVVERLLFFKSASTNPEALEEAFGKAVSENNIGEARKWSGHRRVLSTGFSSRPSPIGVSEGGHEATCRAAGPP